MNKFALFGNPISHSKSSLIHKLFSKQININYEYINICTKHENFKESFLEFIKNKGLGANITVPFKEVVVNYCNKLTNRSLLSNSVNVIKKKIDGTILGDNTDGLGLIFDLNRLNYINEKYKVLLIGAGGAVKSIIPNLILKVFDITIINRTIKKSYKIKNYYYNKGIKNIHIFNLKDTYKKKFDLIINATSSGIYGEIPRIPSLLINNNVKCYDLFYDLNKDTPFISWCKYKGSKFNSDGLGMLVGQAAYSCYIWHNVMPNILLTINIIKNNLF